MRTDGKAGPDWAAIKAEYEKTNKSVRELGRWFSISETAIRKKAKANGWARPAPKSSHSEPSRAVVVSTIIPAAASDVGAIIGRGRNLIVRLMDELDASTTHIGELEDMIEDETSDDKDTRRRNALMKAVDLPVRAGAIKNLASALKTLNEAKTTGKKEQAQEKAETAGADSDWGEDLDGPSTRPN